MRWGGLHLFKSPARKGGTAGKQEGVPRKGFQTDSEEPAAQKTVKPGRTRQGRSLLEQLEGSPSARSGGGASVPTLRAPLPPHQPDSPSSKGGIRNRFCWTSSSVTRCRWESASRGGAEQGWGRHPPSREPGGGARVPWAQEGAPEAEQGGKMGAEGLSLPHQIPGSCPGPRRPQTSIGHQHGARLLLARHPSALHPSPPAAPPTT